MLPLALSTSDYVPALVGSRAAYCSFELNRELYFAFPKLTVVLDNVVYIPPPPHAQFFLHVVLGH